MEQQLLKGSFYTSFPLDQAPGCGERYTLIVKTIKTQSQNWTKNARRSRIVRIKLWYSPKERDHKKTNCCRSKRGRFILQFKVKVWFNRLSFPDTISLVIKGEFSEKVKQNWSFFYSFFTIILNAIVAGHTIITVLPEISCNGLTKDNLPQLLEQTRNLMQTTFTEISKETKLSAVI